MFKEWMTGKVQGLLIHSCSQTRISLSRFSCTIMYVRKHLILLLYLMLMTSQDGHRNRYKPSPRVTISSLLCGRIPAPYSFCISSIADGPRNWKMTEQFSLSCSYSPHLCNKMNHFNTKLSFLANKQDNISLWHWGLVQPSLMLYETWGYNERWTFALPLLSSLIHLLWLLVCLPLTIQGKKAGREFFSLLQP